MVNIKARNHHMRGLLYLGSAWLVAGCVSVSTQVPVPLQDNAEAVVFDIDGTLTPTPSQIGSVRQNAAAVVREYADAGYQIIYLSARIWPLQFSIPNWLRTNGFPSGSLHVPIVEDLEKSTAQYKTDVLHSYIMLGWQLKYAYGDSSTDFEAYANASLPRRQVFALRRVGDQECQPGRWQACLPGWDGHLQSISDRL